MQRRCEQSVQARDKHNVQVEAKYVSVMSEMGAAYSTLIARFATMLAENSQGSCSKKLPPGKAQ